MDDQEMIAGVVGRLNTFGAFLGRVKAGPMSFARIYAPGIENWHKTT